MRDRNKIAKMTRGEAVEHFASRAERINAEAVEHNNTCEYLCERRCPDPEARPCVDCWKAQKLPVPIVVIR